MTVEEALGVFNNLIEVSLKAGVLATRKDTMLMNEAYDTLEVNIIQKMAMDKMMLEKMHKVEDNEVNEVKPSIE